MDWIWSDQVYLRQCKDWEWSGIFWSRDLVESFCLPVGYQCSLHSGSSTHIMQQPSRCALASVTEDSSPPLHNKVINQYSHCCSPRPFILWLIGLWVFKASKGLVVSSCTMQWLIVLRDCLQVRAKDWSTSFPVHYCRQASSKMFSIALTTTREIIFLWSL